MLHFVIILCTANYRRWVKSGAFIWKIVIVVRLSNDSVCSLTITATAAKIYDAMRNVTYRAIEAEFVVDFRAQLPSSRTSRGRIHSFGRCRDANERRTVSVVVYTATVHV